MSKATTSINSFTSGEWSPRAKGRTDLAKYDSGASRLENWIINQLGGVSFRPGTRYIAETKHSAASQDLKSRLIPFQYSVDSDYVIEMGNQYFKLYENDTDAVVDTVADTYTKLLIHANGTDAYGINGGSVIDSGNTVHTITKAGTAEISPLAYKLGNCSLFLDGDSDYVSAADHADFDTAVGNYTIDCWINFDTLPTAGNGMYIFSQQVAPAGDVHAFSVDNAAGVYTLRYSCQGSAQVDLTEVFTPVIDTWYHVAVVREGNVHTLYLNGAAVDTTTKANTPSAFDSAFYVGVYYNGGAFGSYWNGFIDELRFSKGLARWSADFTPSTTEYTSDANTQLLLHFNTIDFSSATAPKIGTFVGTAQLDTAQYKDLTGYATTRASLLLDGNSDSVTFPDSADFYFGTGDFTIEAFVRFAGIGAQQTICGQYEDANNYWFLQITAANKLQIKFVDGAATKGDYIMTDAWAGLAINTWYHIMVVRYANAAGTAADKNIKIFIDGTSQTLTETTAITTNNVGDMVAILDIGKQNAATYFNGWIDEFRITKGLARQTTTFTPTTAEYALTPITTTEVTTPYLTAELFSVQYAQNNDVLYLTHPNWQPRKLTRTSATAFSIATATFVRPPFLDTNTTATNTITPSADTGNGITLTAVDDTFLATNVGGYYRVKSGVVKITAFTSTKVVTGNVQAEPAGTAGNLATGPGATADWAESAWSDRRGWPACVAFHEQRLYYAKSTHEPQKFWASYIGSYDCYDQTAVTDNYAIDFEVATEQRNAIKWLSSGVKALTIGTQGGTFSATSGETTSTIAPDNIVVSRDTNYGVAGLMPKRISSFLYYLQRDLFRVRELAYSTEYYSDALISNDMNLLAEHILKDGSGVLDLDHQQAPNDRIYCVRSDGELSVLTRNPEQEVMGWSRFVAGEDAKGYGTFESVCVIPKASADDQVWVIVKRNINGTTKRFIEFFMTESFDEDWDAIRCDCSLTLDSPKTITGMTNASPGVFSCTAHGFSTGDQVKINSVVLAKVSGVDSADINGTYLLVEGADADKFTLTTLAGVAINPTTAAGYGAYVSGGEVRKMVTNISGLGHLVGETVVAQTDGYIPATETYTVAAGGSIILSEKAAVVHVGLPYEGTVQLLKLSEGSPLGTGQTKTRRIYLGTLRLYRSQGLSIGRTTTTLDALNYNEETDSEALFTGDMDKVFQTTWDKSDEIMISQTKPLPAEILAVILRSEVEE